MLFSRTSPGYWPHQVKTEGMCWELLKSLIGSNYRKREKQRGSSSGSGRTGELQLQVRMAPESKVESPSWVVGKRGKTLWSPDLSLASHCATCNMKFCTWFCKKQISFQKSAWSRSRNDLLLANYFSFIFTTFYYLPNIVLENGSLCFAGVCYCPPCCSQFNLVLYNLQGIWVTHW